MAVPGKQMNMELLQQLQRAIQASQAAQSQLPVVVRGPNDTGGGKQALVSAASQCGAGPQTVLQVRQIVALLTSNIKLYLLQFVLDLVQVNSRVIKDKLENKKFSWHGKLSNGFVLGVQSLTHLSSGMEESHSCLVDAKIACYLHVVVTHGFPLPNHSPTQILIIGATARRFAGGHVDVYIATSEIVFHFKLTSFPYSRSFLDTICM